MNPLFSIISLLICSAYSQTCNNTHTQSLLLSISIHGNSISKIGISNYLSIVEAAANVIVPTGITRVGINTFGGITATNTMKTQLPMNSTTWSTVESTIQRLASADFDSNYGNVVSDAVEEALLTSFMGQKYHIIFTVGTPIASGYGTTTNPINFNDPCPNSITAKQNNIQQYVVLIGSQGIEYVKEYFSCMVEDPDTDIIMINPSNITAGIAQLHSRVCKPDGIDIKITEINPVDSNYRPFIEVLNHGASADIAVCWESNSCSTSAIVSTGSYYVGYGSGTGDVPTAEHNGDNLGNNNDVSNWIAKVQANGIDINEAFVTYGSDSYWQTHIDGNTFELRGVGYNNKYGGNWRMSCYPNSSGSPGSAPVECHEEDNSCSVEDCDLNGAASSCVGEVFTNSLCQCQNTFLEDIHACIPMPVPTACQVYVTNNEVTKKDMAYFVWDRVRWDDQVHYYLIYSGNNGAVDIWHAGSVAAAAIDDVSSGVKTGSTAASITIQSIYTAPIRSTVVSASVDLTCDVFISEATNNPTITPTSDKTNEETTENTTPSPTYDLPGVFLSDICGISRCECWDDVRNCCIPFGPDENATTLSSPSVIPELGCDNQFKIIEIQSSDGDTSSHSIRFKKYGDTSRTEIIWSMRSYGVINQTDFEDLTKWTDYYPSSDALDINMENTLNIDVYPPGNNNVTTGTVVITDGEDTGELILSISVGYDDGERPLSQDECVSQGLGFQLVATSCTSLGSSECMPLYPHTLWIMISRSNQLCFWFFDDPPIEETRTFYWWVILTLVLFIVLLAWLVHRFWLKQKNTTDEIGDVEDELQHVEGANEAGLHGDLEQGDIVFNDLATGVPGHTQPTDVFGNNLHQIQMQQQNDMVHIAAETFVVRTDFGQTVTEPRYQQQQMNEKYRRF